MCGIAGRVNFRSGAPVDRAIVARMSGLLAHRGPDGQDLWTEGHVGLGHRRLAIIDLSDGGRQPMAYADGRLRITFNGEIYNYRELRSDLQGRGHRFHTQSDTEVILAAYAEYGASCVERLNGMFAFGIWDRVKRTLFLARDRVGKKPLYYRFDGDGIAFASEPKAFLAEPGFASRADLSAIDWYLSYQYVPAPLSALAGVRRLEPAHHLLVGGEGSEPQRYWRLQYGRKLRLSEQDAAEQVLAKLDAAVRRRLVSDVPLGAFLSGGIDSASIVALMARAGGGPVKTFSIGFEEDAYNELPFARMVAERYATDHHEFIVRPDAVELVPKIAWHYNEPFADSSAIPTFYLSELTRRHVTVALNGDGGDESFAGYDRYSAIVLAQRYARLPRVIRRTIATTLELLPAAELRSTIGRARRFVEPMDLPVERRYCRWMMHFTPDMKEWLCTPDFRAAAGARDPDELLLKRYRATDAPDIIDATLDVDLQTYLPDDLLVKVDIATMAHGLEARSPLLDYELMEFLASLPATYKVKRGAKKYILKKAVADLLPPAILSRPKRGFGVPIEQWFRTDLREFASDLLLSKRATERGYFRRAAIARLLEEHASGVRSWHYQLWNLVMLETWHRRVLDDATPDVGTEMIEAVRVG
jgi:asparagine synthase (glutamine-hydrolysing)